MHFAIVWYWQRVLDGASAAIEYARAYIDFLRGKPWED